MKKKYNIACLGVGKHAIKNILPVIKNSDLYNLEGIYCRNYNKSSKIAKDYNCKKFLTINSLLNNKDVDIIYISSPPSLHFPHAIRGLNAKKNIIIEKPICLKVSEAAELIKTAKKFDLALMEGFMYRFHKQFSELKKIFYKEKKSNLKTIEATFGIPDLERNNIRYKKKLGGGALFDIGVYPISLINIFFKGKKTIINSSYKSLNNKNVDTFGEVRLKIGIKKLALIKWYIGGNYRNFIKLNFNRSSYHINFAFSKAKDLKTLIIHNSGKKKKFMEISPDNHFKNMFKYFYKLIRNKNLKKNEYQLILSQLNTLEMITLDKKNS